MGGSRRGWGETRTLPSEPGVAALAPTQDALAPPEQGQRAGDLRIAGERQAAPRGGGHGSPTGGKLGAAAVTRAGAASPAPLLAERALRPAVREAPGGRDWATGPSEGGASECLFLGDILPKWAKRFESLEQ